MLNVKLGYSLIGGNDSSEQLSNPLFMLLETIHRTGSIAHAATSLGLSYRHVWGALKKWEEVLGSELILWERGKRARLSSFGTKLLFAEQRAKARAMPQVNNLIAQMEKEFALAFDREVHVITLFASHDMALSRLRDMFAAHAKVHLAVEYHGSMDSVAALSRGECQLAGFHVSEDRARGSLTQKAFKTLLRPGRHKLITFLSRQQGLMTAPKNPLRIRTLHDLTRREVRIVNRQPGSGTRLELEQLLEKEGIPYTAIRGFDNTEMTHLSLAAAVASGQADAGFGLHFIPLVREQYYLACMKDSLHDPATAKFLALLRSGAWHGVISDLPGYEASHAGEIVSLKNVMPWYSFRSRATVS
jgi:putative molybdopterin biosynthesis protein